jgi:hypothetical protein
MTWKMTWRYYLSRDGPCKSSVHGTSRGETLTTTKKSAKRCGTNLKSENRRSKQKTMEVNHFSSMDGNPARSKRKWDWLTRAKRNILSSAAADTPINHSPPRRREIPPPTGSHRSPPPPRTASRRHATPPCAVEDPERARRLARPFPARYRPLFLLVLSCLPLLHSTPPPLCRCATIARVLPLPRGAPPATIVGKCVRA